MARETLFVESGFLLVLRCGQFCVIVVVHADFDNAASLHDKDVIDIAPPKNKQQ
jgi:hypothetical protein